jgi:hypothetical protein
MIDNVKLADHTMDDSDDAEHAQQDQKIKIIWSQWSEMEQLFKDHHVEAEYREHVPLAEVDVRKSLENMARMGPRLDQQSIDSMVIKARMHKYLYLPAMVAWRNKAGKLIYADGNHRHAGVRRLHATHAAMYILVDPTQIQIDGVTMGANAIVGRGSSHDEKMRHGKQYYRSHPNCSYQAAANIGGVGLHSLKQAIKAEDMEHRFSVDGDLPVPGAEAFNSTVRYNLSMIPNDAVLQYAAGQLLTLSGFTHYHAERLQRAVRAAKPHTERGMIAAVDTEILTFMDELELEAGPQRGPDARQRTVIRGLRQCQNMLKKIFGDDVNPKDVLTDVELRRVFIELSGKINVTIARIKRRL